MNLFTCSVTMWEGIIPLILEVDLMGRSESARRRGHVPKDAEGTCPLR